MQYVILHDKTKIEKALSRDIGLNLYAIGDLDDFFWPYTTWFADSECAENILLLYTGQAPPTLIALTRDDPDGKAKLISEVLPFLPRYFYVHMSPGVLERVKHLHLQYDCKPEYRMCLKQLQEVDSDEYDIRRLAVPDLETISRLYNESYPENWFDARMLETNKYFGCYSGNDLVSIAGIHVYSETYKIAALGNITTHPDYRRQSYGRRLTAHLCRDLLKTVDHIGLNVKQDNPAAIRIYESCGFKIVAEIEEYLLENTWEPRQADGSGDS